MCVCVLSIFIIIQFSISKYLFTLKYRIILQLCTSFFLPVSIVEPPPDSW